MPLQRSPFALIALHPRIGDHPPPRSSHSPSRGARGPLRKITSSSCGGGGEGRRGAGGENLRQIRATAHATNTPAFTEKSDLAFVHIYLRCVTVTSSIPRPIYAFASSPSRQPSGYPEPRPPPRALCPLRECPDVPDKLTFVSRFVRMSALSEPFCRSGST